MEQIALGELQMTFKEYYALTPRSFSNAVFGYRKKEEIYSRERFLIMRKLMYASLKPYSKGSFEETDVMQFPWEEKVLQELSAEKAAQAKIDIENIENFWKKFDENQVGKA